MHRSINWNAIYHKILYFLTPSLILLLVPTLRLLLLPPPPPPPPTTTTTSDASATRFLIGLFGCSTSWLLNATNIDLAFPFAATAKGAGARLSELRFQYSHATVELQPPSSLTPVASNLPTVTTTTLTSLAVIEVNKVAMGVSLICDGALCSLLLSRTLANGGGVRHGAIVIVLLEDVVGVLAVVVALFFNRRHRQQRRLSTRDNQSEED